MHTVLSIDKDKTKELSNSIDFIPCDCNDCKHYYECIKELVPEAKLFFDSIGIVLDKCQELWCYFPDDNGFSHYSGYFKVAMKASAKKSKDSITKNWEALDFGKCHFRIRLEIDKNGNTILGFEADLPLEKAL